MKIPMKNLKILGGVLLLGGTLLTLTTKASGQTVLFSDNFDLDTSASWSVFQGNGSTTTPDFTAQFAFNYGTNTYTSNGVSFTIPEAPSTVGTSNKKGLKMTVNKNDAVAA